jgi:signal transduction histidine kinase
MKRYYIIIISIIIASLIFIAFLNLYQLNFQQRLLNTQQSLRLYRDKAINFSMTVHKYADDILTSINIRGKATINKNIKNVYSEIGNFKNLLKVDTILKTCLYCHKQNDSKLNSLRTALNNITDIATQLYNELSIYTTNKKKIETIILLKNELSNQTNILTESLNMMVNHLSKEAFNKFEFFYKLELILTGTLILLNLFFMSLFYRSIIKDIDNLVTITNSISDEKKVDNINLKKFHNQEIREFVSLFISALNKIHEKEKELQEQMEEIKCMNEELQASNQQMEMLTFELEEVRENLENIVKEKTKELQRAYQELQELDTLKSNFLHSISHEFKTPLTPLFGYLKLFKNKDLGELTPLQEQSIDIMLTCAEKLYNTIEDIILLARLDVEKEQYILKDVDLAYLLKTTISRVEKELSEKKITLVKDIPNISIIIVGDQLMLIQTFLHILRNAIKFTPEKGTIRVILSIEDKNAVVRVIDSGPGMPEKILNEINEYLTSKNTYISKKGDAITIGLNLMKRVIIIHNASVQYKSEKGKGTEVKITFPTKG